MAIRSFLFAAVLPLSLLACGGDDGGTVTPTGPHHHFVVNKAFVPTTRAQVSEFGLDLDGDKAVDNQLGSVLQTLGTMGFDIQTSIDAAVAGGSITLLADLQTAAYDTSSGAGLKVLLGSNPMPAPCTDANDTVCGHHLTGTGTFDISANSPQDAEVTGKIVNGVFNGGPGTLNLQIALAGTMPINLDLIGARAQLSGMSDNGITTALVAGAVTQDALNTQILPAIQAQLGPLIARDCNALTAPPACGCMDGSTGKQILSLFDTDPQDCAVTVPEIQNNGIIRSLLAPDVTIDGAMALSIGLKVSAVKGTYTVAGE